jgi:hypothetical protein
MHKDNYSWIEKTIVITFDIMIVISLVLLIYSFSLCVGYDNSEALLHIKTGRDINEENKQIKLFSLIASILFIVGNLYKIGNITTLLAFYSIEKEFFPAPHKKFYMSMKNSVDKDDHPDLSHIVKPYFLDNRENLENNKEDFDPLLHNKSQSLSKNE